MNGTRTFSQMEQEAAERRLLLLEAQEASHDTEDRDAFFRLLLDMARKGKVVIPAELDEELAEWEIEQLQKEQPTEELEDDSDEGPWCPPLPRN
jgi:hypothetical protein